MSRIVIEDLPSLESLSKEQLAEIFGAGRNTHRRLTFQSLEERKVMSASPLTFGLPQAPALTSRPVNMTAPSVVFQASNSSGSASGASSGILSELGLAESLLSAANHDYDGFRAKADNQVVAAINALASNQTKLPQLSTHEAQQTSDGQLEEALAILEMVQSQPAALPSSAAKDVTNAITDVILAWSPSTSRLARQPRRPLPRPHIPDRRSTSHGTASPAPRGTRLTNGSAAIGCKSEPWAAAAPVVPSIP